jgi:hypothetical protein
MLFLLLLEKISESVHVVAKALSQFAPYRSDFRYHRVVVRRFHGASSSSGVQTIGGS